MSQISHRSPGGPSRRVVRDGASRRVGFRVFRFCCRTLICLLLLATLLLVYLQHVGIPRWTRQLWLDALAHNGHYVDVGRITFNPFQGAMAHAFRYYDSDVRLLPLLEADRVELDINPLAWIDGRSGLTAMTVVGGSARFSFGTALQLAPEDQILTIDRLHTSLRIDGDTLHIETLKAMLLGIELIGSGEIDLQRDPGFRGLAAGFFKRGAAGDGQGAWVSNLVEQLNGIEFESPPQLNLQFDIRPRDLATSKVQIAGQGGPTRLRLSGVSFASWRLYCTYQDDRFTVQKISAQADGGNLAATGVFDLESGVLEAALHSSLPPAHWTSLMPITWRDRLAEWGFYFGGEVTCDIELGPAPVAEIWKQFAGRIELKDAVIREVPIDSARGRFFCAESRLSFEDIEVQIGDHAHGGGLRGSFRWHLDEHKYDGHLVSDVDFIHLEPILPASHVKLARNLEYTHAPLHLEVDFSGTQGETNAFTLTGTAAGTNLFYKGAYMNESRADLHFAKRVLTLSSLHAERDEGQVDGLLRLDFAEKRADVEATSTVDPKAAARAVGKKLEQIFSHFSFDGPNRTQVSGSIHFSTNGVTDLRASAVAEGMGVHSFVSDAVSFDMHWTNRLITVSNIQALIYGGKLTGTYTTTPDATETNRLHYSMAIELDDVLFEDVVRTLVHKDGEPYHGRLSGDLRLEGLFGTAQGRKSVGTGRVEINQGRIMLIPLFGGLSSWLSKVYPGLGFTRQSNFSSSFNLSDLNIRLPDAELTGALFRIQGEGTYRMPDKGLDFDVEFQLLGDGAVGEVVRLVTRPLTKLLEFDLEGTLDEPQWRPKSLPRELFVGEEE
jgi:hypothetical protein